MRKVNWNYWLRKKNWSLPDAVALLFEYELEGADERQRLDDTRCHWPPKQPEGMSEEKYAEVTRTYQLAVVSIQNYLNPPSMPTSGKYMLPLANKEIVGQHSFQGSPRNAIASCHRAQVSRNVFLAWAVDNEISLPPELDDFIRGKSELDEISEHDRACLPFLKKIQSVIKAIRTESLITSDGKPIVLSYDHDYLWEEVGQDELPKIIVKLAEDEKVFDIKTIFTPTSIFEAGPRQYELVLLPAFEPYSEKIRRRITRIEGKDFDDDNRLQSFPQKPDGEASQASEKNKFPYKLPAGTKWSNIIIKFLDDENILIQVLQFKHETNYTNMGLTGHGNKPSTLWVFLKVLSLHEGEMTIKDPAALDKYKKQKELLSKKLQDYFSIDYDPFFPYKSSEEKKGNSYKIKITLIPPPKDNAANESKIKNDDDSELLELMEEESNKYSAKKMI